MQLITLTVGCVFTNCYLLANDEGEALVIDPGGDPEVIIDSVRSNAWRVRYILATHAHHPQRRPPLLAEGREAAARWVGAAEATHLVETRPLGILANLAPDAMPPRLQSKRTRRENEGLWRRLFGRAA